MIKEVKILEVHVDKGMKHGQRITFAGEADQAPGVEPGDIVLLLQEKEHEVIWSLKCKVAMDEIFQRIQWIINLC